MRARSEVSLLVASLVKKGGRYEVTGRGNRARSKGVPAPGVAKSG